jgi:hypothetical protein
MNPEAIVYLIALLINNGAPALLSIMKEWQKADPTMTDLEVLKGIPIDPDA